MAAASNESFGLKIATASSIALAVVLLVSVYFINSERLQATEKLAAAEKKVGETGGQLRTVQEQANEYRTRLGYGPIEDHEAALAQMKKDEEALKGEVQAIGADVNAQVADFQKKAGKAIDAAQYDAIRERSREVVESFLTNADQTKKAQATRLKDLLANSVRLAAATQLNYADIKRSNDNANKVNAEAKSVVEAKLAQTQGELEAAIKAGESTRAELVTSVQQKTEDLANLGDKLSNTINEASTKNEAKEKLVGELRSVIRSVREEQSQKQEVMSKPGGRVTFVDYGSGTARISVNRTQGVRPMMQFTIFDRKATGLISDKPKALVEITKVGDPARGENDSLVRIVKTYEANDPIRYNDYIYSAGWSYDHPQRFALVGKIDINRDGRDDRGDLIRMIEASGGVVEFDLPPPNVDRTPGQAAVARAFARLGEPQPASTGRASGKISGLAFGYVIDRRTSTVLFAAKAADPAKEDTAFLEEESRAIKEATDQAVRPLPLEKLLNLLGYDYSMPIEGRREAYDKTSVQDLLKPKTKQESTKSASPSNP